MIEAQLDAGYDVATRRHVKVLLTTGEIDHRSRGRLSSSRPRSPERLCAHRRAVSLRRARRPHVVDQLGAHRGADRGAIVSAVEGMLKMMTDVVGQGPASRRRQPRENPGCGRGAAGCVEPSADAPGNPAARRTDHSRARAPPPAAGNQRRIRSRVAERRLQSHDSAKRIGDRREHRARSKRECTGCNECNECSSVRHPSHRSHPSHPLHPLTRFTRLTRCHPLHPPHRVATGAPPIDRLFRLMVESKASDLHLSSGMPPLIRKDGKIEPLEAGRPGRSRPRK